GVIGSIVLLTISPLLGEVALKIGSREMFAVAVLGVTIISSLSVNSVMKGLLSGFMGLLISMIGMHELTGISRFTYGSIYFVDGISIVVVILWLLSITKAMKLIIADTSG